MNLYGMTISLVLASYIAAGEQGSWQNHSGNRTYFALALPTSINPSWNRICRCLARSHQAQYAHICPPLSQTGYIVRQTIQNLPRYAPGRRASQAKKASISSCAAWSGGNSSLLAPLHVTEFDLGSTRSRPQPKQLVSISRTETTACLGGATPVCVCVGNAKQRRETADNLRARAAIHPASKSGQRPQWQPQLPPNSPGECSLESGSGCIGDIQIVLSKLDI